MRNGERWFWSGVLVLVLWGGIQAFPPPQADAQSKLDYREAVRALKEISRETKLLRQEVSAIRRRCNDPIGGI